MPTMNSSLCSPSNCYFRRFEQCLAIHFCGDVSSGHGYQENYSEKIGLAAIGSSDDHFNLLTGTAVTAYDGSLHNNLINAVKAKETKAIMVDNSLQPLLKLARYAITSYA